jgi:hypothetical protein
VSSQLIASDSEFASEQKLTLQSLVGCIIPASDEYDVPGADDPNIFAEILRATAPLATEIRRGLEDLDKLSDTDHGAFFSDLSGADKINIASHFRSSQALWVDRLVNIVIPCYYRDSRVMRSLGMEARPPFPDGFKLEQGDWSLLDVVRERPKMYRDADGY